MSAEAKPHRLLLACLPKSGSTFLALVLAGLPGFQKISLVPGYGRREQELSFEHLLVAEHNCGHFVAQHHVRYSAETQRLIELFSLQPIVLVRNLHDVVVSVRDHLKSGGMVIAQAYIPPELLGWEDERANQFIVDMVLPWYFNFYASWAECGCRVQVTYDELAANTQAAVARICKSAGIQASDEVIGTAVQAARLHPEFTRFNVGVSGRGKELSPKVVSRIERLAEYYRFLDLTPLGVRKLG